MVYKEVKRNIKKYKDAEPSGEGMGGQPQPNLELSVQYAQVLKWVILEALKGECSCQVCKKIQDTMPLLSQLSTPKS